MLKLIDSSNSTHVVIEAIKKICNEYLQPVFYANTEAIITVKNGETIIIDSEKIRINLIFDGTNYANVNIYWEDFGYENYKSLGLFGQMSTKWQMVKECGSNCIMVDSEPNNIYINFSVCSHESGIQK